MKKAIYLLLPVILLGCKQPAPEIDKRPKDELAFIKEISDADSIYESQKNDIGKKEIIDRNQIAIPNYIRATLNSKAENWHATIQSIKLDNLMGNVEVVLRISKGLHFDEKAPEYNSVILRSTGIYEKSDVRNSLKGLREGDRVIVSGNFTLEKSIRGYIPDAYGAPPVNDSFILSNPEFSFVITDIKKNKEHY